MNTKYTQIQDRFLVITDPADSASGGGAALTEEQKDDALMSALFGTVDQDKEAASKPAGTSVTLEEALAAQSGDAEAAAAKKKTDDDAAAQKLIDDKKKEDDAAAAAAQKKADDEAAAAAPPITVKRKAAPVVDDPKVKADEAAAVERKKFEGTLLEEELEALNLARFAEKKDPAKYKGYAERTEKYLRELQAKTGAADFDANSPEYLAWVEKNKPKFSAGEVRALDRAMGAEEVAETTRKQNVEVLDKVYRQIEAPRVQAEADRYFAAATAAALPDDIAKVLKEAGNEKAGIEKARTEFPLEFEIADRVLDQAASDVEELLLISRTNPDTKTPLKAFDPKNPQHNRVAALVNDVCADFKKNGGAELIRDGKRFLTRQEYAGATPALKAVSWTLPTAEIIKRSIPLVKARIAGEISKEQGRLEKLGFTRKPRATASETPEQKAAAQKLADEKAAALKQTSVPAAQRAAPLPTGSAEEQPTEADKAIALSLFGTPESSS